MQALLVAKQLANERLVFFDEFVIYDRPSLFYGWAERNTLTCGSSLCQVKSDERKKRNKLNGMLCVDAVIGEEFFRLSPGSKTEDVSEYLAELCLDCVELGYDRLCIILDNNPTHKQKMQSQLALHLEQMGLWKSLTVEYLYLPSCSPKLNLVEYVIHLARLRFLHHLPMGTTLEQIERSAFAQIVVLRDD